MHMCMHMHMWNTTIALGLQVRSHRVAARLAPRRSFSAARSSGLVAADGCHVCDRTGGATLRGARQFVYGPPNVKDDLRGIDREGGTSIECTYEIPPGPGGAAPPDEARPASHVLLASSGSLTKLPSFAYRLDFTQPARAYALPSAGGAGAADGDDGVVSLPELPAAAADSLIRTAVGGATLKQISYLSERVWISRGGDGSALAVLARCNARALAPPAGRPDLTAPCSDTRGTLCRRRAQF